MPACGYLLILGLEGFGDGSGSIVSGSLMECQPNVMEIRVEVDVDGVYW